jgi:D-3-phosphoglycerate dehydrogenase / 2-oxoglutarate reductase
MIKILANDGIHPYGKQLLEEANYFVDTNNYPQAELPKILPDYDVIIVRSATKVRKELIDACPNLKIIARGGVGMDNIDYDYAVSKGIRVFNTPAASSQAVAELAFAHMFSLARLLHNSNRNMPKKGDTEFEKLKKVASKGIQLRGRTLGIIGFGRIGQEVARIGLAMGMNVMPVDLVNSTREIGINLYNLEDVRLSIKLATTDWDKMLRKADFITLHVPYSGKPLIGKEELEKMKNTSYVINTARGGAVDEEALLYALNNGKIAGAGLDVFENEPSPRKELLEHPLVSLSPHIGAATMEAQTNISLEIAEQILAFFGDDK